MTLEAHNDLITLLCQSFKNYNQYGVSILCKLLLVFLSIRGHFDYTLYLITF